LRYSFSAKHPESKNENENENRREGGGGVSIYEELLLNYEQTEEERMEDGEGGTYIRSTVGLES
jgi:hypothetical protein